MKELKTTKTIEEIYGYQASDGKFFEDKAECKKYEQTAEMVIYNDFKRLMVGGDTFSENQIWENYGYGSDDFSLAVIEIKDEADLRIANMFGEIHKKGTLSPDVIGKRILVSIGNEYNYDCGWFARTEEQLIEDFKKDIAKFFHPKKESD